MPEVLYTTSVLQASYRELHMVAKEKKERMKQMAATRLEPGWMMAATLPQLLKDQL